MKTKIAMFVCFVLLFTSSICFAQRVSVSVRAANVRVGPGTKYAIAWERLDRYYPLIVLSSSNSWYYVKDYENDMGWINKSVVSKVASVITKKDNCNVRSGAGTGYKIVFVVDNGVPFKVLKRKGSWIQIKHADGDTGWIHKSLVW